MTGLAPIDALTLLAVVIKAADYGASLLAMGGVLFVLLFAARAEPAVFRMAIRVAVLAALAGLVILAVRFGIRAARISGMGFEGATDPMMLSFVWQSPLGAAAVWRGIGEALILAVLLPHVGRWFALLGTFAVAISFTQVGHSLGDPRGALAILLTTHLLAAALWIGALLPLRKAAGTPAGAALLHQFGVVAIYGVAVLGLAGIVLSWLLSGSLAALFGTAYGSVLMAKVLLVSGLLAIAAFNKLRLVPALANAEPDSVSALHRAIGMEMVTVGFILLATATLTTMTTPAVNL